MIKLLTQPNISINFSGLLHKEPGFRLGCRRVGHAEEGAEELKIHPFFAHSEVKSGREPVPWKKMEAGKVNKILF